MNSSLHRCRRENSWGKRGPGGAAHGGDAGGAATADILGPHMAGEGPGKREPSPRCCPRFKPAAPGALRGGSRVQARDRPRGNHGNRGGPACPTRRPVARCIVGRGRWPPPCCGGEGTRAVRRCGTSLPFSSRLPPAPQLAEPPSARPCARELGAAMGRARLPPQRVPGPRG